MKRRNKTISTEWPSLTGASVLSPEKGWNMSPTDRSVAQTLHIPQMSQVVVAADRLFLYPDSYKASPWQ